MDRCLFWESCFQLRSWRLFSPSRSRPGCCCMQCCWGSLWGWDSMCCGTLRLLLPHGKLATALEDVAFLLVWAAGAALFFHGSGTGRVPGLLLDGQRPGLSAVPLYPGMRHRAAAAPDLFGSGQAFPAAVPAAVPRCCADLHPVEPEIWTFRQTFSKSIFFFAFTLAER